MRQEWDVRISGSLPGSEAEAAICCGALVCSDGGSVYDRIGTFLPMLHNSQQDHGCYPLFGPLPCNGGFTGWDYIGVCCQCHIFAARLRIPATAWLHIAMLALYVIARALYANAA